MNERAARRYAALATALILVAVACSSSDAPVAGSPDGGLDGTAGDEGDADNPIFSNDTGAPDATEGGNVFSDALIDVDAGDSCLSPDAGPAPLPRRCAPPTNNECDGATDTWLLAHAVDASLKNNSLGNGFDDDCDGIVDEGCSCGGNGRTRDCYLVPATQADPVTKVPVGWCATNSKGSLDCAGSTEFPYWSGTCRGAQPPYQHDVCAPGDFNCDGLAQNSDLQDCTCKATNVVTCPTATLVEAPYPAPHAIQVIDGSQWIVDPLKRPSATNWTWTVIGGDCDNVLPHPTFALYNQTDSTVANTRKGTRTLVRYDASLAPPRYTADPASTIQSIQTSSVPGGTIYPAFGLSGDYIVQGEFDLGGGHFVCTQKVEVRAPGLRAELCWDTVGGEGGAPGNDLDLHVSRLQLKPTQTCASGGFGWDTTCKAGSTYEDCWWDPTSGCRDYSNVPPDWGYADSPTSACLGWSSKRQPVGGPDYKQPCTNPRLDRDNISCDPSIEDPTVVGSLLVGPHFCGPENINIDNPADNDQFVIGVNHFQNYAGPSAAKPHVNLYCNGERVLSSGYNPVTGQTSFPLLKQVGAAGQDTTGDQWTVAKVTTHVDLAGKITSCDVATIPSHNPDPSRDGPGTSLCVESKDNASVPPWQYVDHRFVDHTALQGTANGTIPATAAGFCKH